MRSLLVIASILIVIPGAGCRPAASVPPADQGSADQGSADQGSGPEARWTYEIRVDDQFERMDLALCIEGQLPRRLTAAREAIGFVRAARVRGGPALERDGRSFEITTLGEHGCVDLEIDLDELANGGSPAGLAGDSLLLAPDDWLWYPARVPERLDARARFELPEGVRATVPWPPLEPGDPEDWRVLDHTSFGWNAWIALGRYEPLWFEAAQCEFEVAILDGQREASEAGIEAWIRVAAETGAELYGRFPRDRVAVVVVPSPAGAGAPVLFGMARRGGGGSVLLLLNPDARDDELPGEWVAVHEFLHLGMPLVIEPWMAEGFVTYYTHVLRARHGVLDGSDQIQAALEILASGFEDRRGLRTLAAASASMRQFGSYRRVYWGGAAAAFDLDVSIRSASANRRSLDDLMVMLWPLAPEHHRLAAAEVIARMEDEVARWYEAGELDREISPAAILDRHLAAKTVPADVQRLRGVAVEVDDGRVGLLANPKGEVQVREALFAPKAKPRGGSPSAP